MPQNFEDLFEFLDMTECDMCKPADESGWMASRDVRVTRQQQRKRVTHLSS